MEKFDNTEEIHLKHFYIVLNLYNKKFKLLKKGKKEISFLAGFNCVLGEIQCARIGSRRIILCWQ